MFANGLERMEGSVRCDKGVSAKKDRKSVTMVDETSSVFRRGDGGTEEKEGRKAELGGAPIKTWEFSLGVTRMDRRRRTEHVR